MKCQKFYLCGKCVYSYALLFFFEAPRLPVKMTSLRAGYGVNILWHRKLDCEMTWLCAVTCQAMLKISRE